MSETVMDIVREMRANKGSQIPYAPMNAIWMCDYQALCDRIEAAWKREMPREKGAAK